MISGNAISQGDSLSINQNIMFRFNRYDTAYTAFNGRDLSPKGYIELNPDTGFCNLILSVDEIKAKDVSIYPNPATSEITVYFNEIVSNEFNLEIINIYGNLVYSKLLTNVNEHKINIDKLASGIYFIRLNNTAVKKFLKL